MQLPDTYRKNLRFKIQLAGENIEIECHNRNILKQCRPYLIDSGSISTYISVNYEDVLGEGLYKNVNNIEFEYPNVAVTSNIAELESLAICRKLVEHLIYKDTLLMHGAVVAKDGFSYMFTAPSGVGKTTRAKLWLHEFPDSIVVNGDKPLIKITENSVLACGSPWCGKEGFNTNTMIPLRAIFLLERVRDGEECSVEKISFGDAFPTLLQQTYHFKNPVKLKKSLLLLKELSNKIHFYRFKSTPTIDAIRLAFNTAKPENC